MRMSAADTDVAVQNLKLSPKSDVKKSAASTPRAPSPPPELSRAALHKSAPVKKPFFSLSSLRRRSSKAVSTHSLSFSDRKVAATHGPSNSVEVLKSGDVAKVKRAATSPEINVDLLNGHSSAESDSKSKTLRSGDKKRAHTSPRLHTRMGSSPALLSPGRGSGGGGGVGARAALQEIKVGARSCGSIPADFGLIVPSPPLTPPLPPSSQGTGAESESAVSGADREGSRRAVSVETVESVDYTSPDSKSREVSPHSVPKCAKFHFTEPVAERQEEFTRLFKLQESEKLLAHYTCALRRNLLQMGDLYISRSYICFYSSGFWKQYITINMSDVLDVARKSTLKQRNAIKIYTSATVAGADGGDQSATARGYVFARFWKTTDAFDMIRRIVYCPKSLAKVRTISEPELSRLESEEDDASESEESDVLPDTLDPEFPELQNIEMTKINEFVVPMSSKDLFGKCFSHKSDFFSQYLESIGSSEITQSAWKEDTKYGTCRNLEYTAKIDDMPAFVQSILKTNSTCVTRLDRLRRAADRFIVCSLVDTPDIPYGTTFHVYHMWDIQDIGPNECRMVATCGVDFVKRVAFISKVILNKSKESYKLNNQKLHSSIMELVDTADSPDTSIKRRRIRTSRRSPRSPRVNARVSRSRSSFDTPQTGGFDTTLKIWMSLFVFVLLLFVVQLYGLRSDLGSLTDAIRAAGCVPTSDRYAT